jgi:hypothetical protein
MANAKKSCNDCVSNSTKYCDGYIFRDWSGRYEGNPKDLPEVPDSNVFWTYQECKKNNKGLKFLNLTGDCTGFELVKAK